jgi:hypothetical protein
MLASVGLANDTAVYNAQLSQVAQLRKELVTANSIAGDAVKWGEFARRWTSSWEKVRDAKPELPKDTELRNIHLDVSTAHGYLMNWFLAIASRKPEDASKWKVESQKMIDSAMRRIVFFEKNSPREFVDATGKFRVTATFVALRNDEVTLKKESGEQITVALKRLSRADREWIVIAATPR